MNDKWDHNNIRPPGHKGIYIFTREQYKSRMSVIVILIKVESCRRIQQTHVECVGHFFWGVLWCKNARNIYVYQWKVRVDR
jgi:hypothetical protein